jgi:hypothetical protein
MRAHAKLLVVLAVLISGCKDEPSRSADPATTGAGQDQTVYDCPMHCVREGDSEPYTQHGPGACPVCGMDLVPQE